MFDFETTVAEIEWKVRKLLEENGRLRTEVEESAERCRVLQEQVNNQNITINNLKEQNNILKLGNTLAQKGDTVEIKLRINQLIRSIDKSLALINKSE
jgi:predicted RNase H-like nuclease (RuvC/YqgF family)